MFCRAFTLIEMVGVLAVIAILSCVLVPKVFEAIHNASIAQVAIGLTTVKTACLGHFAKYGAMPVDGSTAPPTVLTPGTNQCLHFDQVLLVEGFLDKLFQVRIGESSIWLLPAAPANADPKDESAAFNLDGAGASNDAIGTLVVEAFITNVTLEDARALNRILDGESDVLGEDAGGNDLKGRVKYASPSGAAVGSGTGGGHGNGGGQGQGGIHGEGHQRGDRVEVHVYLGHK